MRDLQRTFEWADEDANTSREHKANWPPLSDVTISMPVERAPSKASEQAQPDVQLTDEPRTSTLLGNSINEQIARLGKEPYGYQWPASRLSRFEMGKLTIASNRLKRPLNQLIKEAVDAYADQLLEELGLRHDESA